MRLKGDHTCEVLYAQQNAIEKQGIIKVEPLRLEALIQVIFSSNGIYLQWVIVPEHALNL